MGEGRGRRKKGNLIGFPFGDSCRIQTCNLLIRSQMLYSVELRSHLRFHHFLFLKSGAKVHVFFILAKFFFAFLHLYVASVYLIAYCRKKYFSLLGFVVVHFAV